MGARVVAGVAVALLGLALAGAADGHAEPMTPPTPVGPYAEGDDVRATVDVTQNDDVYDLSPGFDYKARMAWSSTKEIRRGGRVAGVEGGGTYIGRVHASTNPGVPCDPTDYSLSESGEVSESSPLTFRIVPKDPKRPGKGLKGWFIHTPSASWKGTLSVTKPSDGMCGESYTQDGGSSFAARAFAGGPLRGGGTPMAAPRVTVQPSGDVRISGSAVYDGVGTRQVVTYAIVCSSPQACFGQVIPKPRKALRIGWKYLGAECIPAARQTFRMRVRVRMIAANGDTSLFGRSWASGMRAGVRFEATTPGTNPSRQWVWASQGGLLPNRRYVRDFTIVTDNVSATQDWRLHIRYVWGITGWRDIERDVIGAGSVTPCGPLDPSAPPA